MSEAAEPAAAAPARRRGDRRGRASDARGSPSSPPDESLFDVLAAGLDPPQSGKGDDDAARSRFIPGWGDSLQSPDSRFLSRQARRIVSSGSSTFERLYRIFVAARAVVGIALLLTQIVGNLLGTRATLGLTVCVVYAAQAISLWVLPRFRLGGPRTQTRLTRRQWLATIGFDLATFSLLHALEPSSAFNLVALLVLPVLMAGVLTARLPALATAAAVSLMLLIAAWRSGLGLGDLTATMTPAGLAGVGFFVITLLTGELAARLAREELTARGSLELARQQAQLNRLVIEEMADGVLVIDRRARVRAANPAARRLLAREGLARVAPFQLQEDAAWAELGALVQRAFDEGRWPEGRADVTLAFGAGVSRTLRLRARFTRPRSAAAAGAGALPAAAGETFCVVFVEDLRSIQARTRQEKLAAMGRVSAGIAHEIRNPLAAIAQANALLAEEAVGAEQQMLTAMVADNVRRLKRLVDDVMEVAPGIDATPRTVDIGAEVGRIVADWARTSGVVLGPDSRLQVALPSQTLVVQFDPEHLRRVLVNLLDNARRYASERRGSIVLRCEPSGATQVRLSLASDGDPIPPDVEHYLFEPFFSTRSRGTGLGLYICRELCERYGGSIDYWQHPQGSPHRNEFVVMARLAPAGAAAAGPEAASGPASLVMRPARP